MSIVSISRIQHRKGLHQDLPQLASAELGWSVDRQKLYIGNGTIAEGAPKLGNSEILTEHSDILRLAETYTFRNTDAGYNPTTGGRSSRFNGIAYGDGVYVAIGTDGLIVTSVDKVLWTPTYSGVTDTLNSICYGNGMFVIVGVNGILLYSTDGTVWHQSANSIYISLNSVVYANSIEQFVAVSNIGTIVGSIDAITWEILATPTSKNLNAIAYDDGMIVVVGSEGKILTSTDGLSWSTKTSNIVTDLKVVKWASDRWIAAGVNSIILYSLDTIDWDFGYSDSFTGAANNGTTWIFVGYGGVIYSTNGTTLEPQESGILVNLNDIIYDADSESFTIVGDNGTILNSVDDGVTWTFPFSDVTTDLNAIVYNSDTARYLIVGSADEDTGRGTVLTSTDLLTWTKINSAVVLGNLNDIVAWNNTVYIVVGDNGTIYRASNPTGTWTSVASGVVDDLHSVAVGHLGGATFRGIAVGRNGTVLSSVNVGLSWVLQDSYVDEHLNGVNYIEWEQDGNPFSRFFAVGNNGTIISSDDGLSTWSAINYATVSHLRNVYYGVGNFWVVGSIGYTAIYGTDLTQVTTLTNISLGSLYTSTSGYNGPILNSVSYGVGLYLVSGQYDSVLSSTNGKNFISQTQRTFSLAYLNSADIYDTIYDGTRFISVGSKGLILQSQFGITWDGVSYVYGNSDTIRPLQKKLDEFVSVKDFGARGDGTTDDTDPINKALYELYCRTPFPAARKKLYFPAGRYIVSDGIRVPSYATLQGEGAHNTVIVQTADPNLVTYVLTTADSNQQVEGQIGFNDAILPTNISVTDMGFVANGDGIWITHCNTASFVRLKLTGPENYPENGDNERAGFYLIGAGLTASSDISISDCTVEKFNSGVEQRSTESSRNVVINSTTFTNLYVGLKLCDDSDGGIGKVNTMTISNCLFDSIASNAIIARNSLNITSTFNSFKDVGNDYLGSNNAIVPVIDFTNDNIGCSSISDQFNRTYEENVSFPWVAGNENTDAWYTGTGIQLGLLTKTSAKNIIMYPSQNQTNTGISFPLDDNGFNQRIHYTIKRQEFLRTGILQINYNVNDTNIDDDSSHTGEVGVVFNIYSDGITAYLQYTSNATAGDFEMSYSMQGVRYS